MKGAVASAAIVAIGDELLDGRHPDLNSAVIARELLDLGIATASIAVAPDQEEPLARLFADRCPPT